MKVAPETLDEIGEARRGQPPQRNGNEKCFARLRASGRRRVVPVEGLANSSPLQAREQATPRVPIPSSSRPAETSGKGTTIPPVATEGECASKRPRAMSGRAWPGKGEHEQASGAAGRMVEGAAADQKGRAIVAIIRADL